MTNDSPSDRIVRGEDNGRHDEDMSVTLPREIAGAVNLMVPPMAGAAALAALSLGVASQVFGLWMGALAGSVAATRRVMEFDVPAGGTVADGASLPRADTLGAKRARNAGESLIADTNAAAGEAGRSASSARRVARPLREGAKLRVVAGVDAADDLKMITGIGPKLEKILKDTGLRTWAQIAALSPEEITDLDTRLGFKGRIERDDWIGQARRLVSGGAA